jgi:hypothetical protein
MTPRPHDLFGEIPVTHDDIARWCEQVRYSTPTQWRHDWYVKNWNVAEKIRQEKLSGAWFAAASIRP